MPIHGYPGNVITANPTAPTSSVATGVWTTEQQLLAISQGNWPGYQYPVERSLRFNSADSAYLNRTFASVGNRATWTWSAWVKRSFLDATATSAAFQTLFHAGVYTTVAFSADKIYFQMADGAGGAWYIQTSQVFRDPSAWYHIVAVLNTPSATASQRMRLYINGVEVTAFSTDQRSSITQSTTSGEINNNISHAIGSNTTPARYFSGYQTEVNFIDGQALTPSSFGQTNPNTGVWEPINYTGTYGTNGFYLNFSDNSNTTAATLGKDYSGNGNNWTPNNFSVTAGAGNDSLVDSPTSYGTDTGVGGEVRGNYCTLNPLAVGANSSQITYSNGNLNASWAATAGYATSTGTIGVSSGKWYWEVTQTASSQNPNIGVVKDGDSLANYVGQTANGYSYYGGSGNKYNNATGTSYGASFAANDVIGVALDMDAGTITFYKNGVSQGQAYSGLSGVFFPAVSDGDASATVAFAINFGQRAFAYTAPSGFKALCTQNLPTPTIGATSTTQANDYFNAVIYAGSASQQVIDSNLSVLDLAWIKNRTTARDHVLVDTVRGGSPMLTLYPNQTYAEDNSSPNYNPTSISGSSITLGGAKLGINNAGENFVMWGWNAGGSNATNTAGTITSTVRANTTSGFSIVTYTGNGTNGATVGHGLGVEPTFLIFKKRDAARYWFVNVKVGSSTYRLKLNATDSTATNPLVTANSTTFTLPDGSYDEVNGNTNTFVAYCFAPVAGYSAFGSYVGNGSADGPFVYVGFRPKWVMVKSSTSIRSWIISDGVRNPYNVTNLYLIPNLSDAEATNNLFDFTSNGFKVRDSIAGINESSQTFIYAAFAENPFKYSLAR